MVFSETLLDHFQSPRNVGEIEHASAEAQDENPVCGDRLHLWLSIEGGQIVDARWRAVGCAPALAAASVMSELLRGMTIEQARAVDRTILSDALGGLPVRKAHAALLAVSTLHKALDRYESG